MTVPGILSEKLKGQKVLAEESLEELHKNPASAKKLMEHLVAEVSKGLDVRAKAQGSAPSLPSRTAAAPVLDLNFSDTDGEAPEKEAIEKPDVQPLQEAWARLKAFKAKSKRTGTDLPTKKAMFKSICEDFQQLYNDLGPDALTVVPVEEVSRVIKEKKKSLKELAAVAEPPEAEEAEQLPKRRRRSTTAA
eukprot:9494830-Pyramimonas_sp.AAC.1